MKIIIDQGYYYYYDRSKCIVYRKIDLRSHLTYINSKACEEIDLITHHVKYLNQVIKTCEKFRSSN